MSWNTSSAGYNSNGSFIPRESTLTVHSHPASITSYSYSTYQAVHAPSSPDHSAPSSNGADPSSPTANLSTSSKAYACPFCFEVGISDGASRISDLRRHFRTKHNTNALWHCSTAGCQMVFDWQSAYENHLKKAHPDTEKNFVLSSIKAMVNCSAQVVFACGFDTCRKVFETPSGSNPMTTAKHYFQHVATHFQDGASTEEWFYTRRIRNLLHQTAIRDTWKALKPRYGSPPLQWQPHNSTILRKRLECQLVGDTRAIVDLAIMLGSHPFNSPESGQLNFYPSEDCNFLATDGVVTPIWPRLPASSIKYELPTNSRSYDFHGTPPSSRFRDEISNSHCGPSPEYATSSQGGGLDMSSHSLIAYRQQPVQGSEQHTRAPSHDWHNQSLYQFSDMDTSIGHFSNAHFHQQSS